MYKFIPILALIFYVQVSSSQTVSCGDTSCGGGALCCNDASLGSVCYNPNTDSCVASAAGNVLCGSSGGVFEAACGTICYDTTSYGCCNSQLFSLQDPASSCSTSAASPAPPNVVCGRNTCGHPMDQCCYDENQNADVCYDPALYSCLPNLSGDTVLCSISEGVCNTTCYDITMYQCCDNQLAQLASGPCPASSCSGLQVSPSQYCCTAQDYTQDKLPCGYTASGVQMQCCGNLVNETTGYTGPSSVFAQCYDPTMYKCCYGGTSAEFDPSYIKPLSYVIPPGMVQACS